MTQIVHLSLVGGDYAEIDAFFENSLQTDFVDICLQSLKQQIGFFLIDTAVGVADHLLTHLQVGGIHPLYRRIPVENATTLHFVGGFEISTIKPLRREVHNLLVHTILRCQQIDCIFVSLHYLLHERGRQPCLFRLVAFHGRRQLAMVAGKHDTVGLADCYPACRFHGLRCLVDEKCAEMIAVEQTMIAADKRRCDDMRRVK